MAEHAPGNRPMLLSFSLRVRTGRAAEAFSCRVLGDPVGLLVEWDYVSLIAFAVVYLSLSI